MATAEETKQALLSSIQKSAEETNHPPYLRDLAEAYALTIRPESKGTVIKVEK